MNSEWMLESLQSLVPLRRLSRDHLNTLLRQWPIRTAHPGQQLPASLWSEPRCCYLLAGEIRISNAEGERRLQADSPLCRYGLSESLSAADRVSAASDLSYWTVDRDRLDSMVAWEQAAQYILLRIASCREFDEDQAWMQALLRSNLFHKVPPMNLDAVLHCFEPCFFDAGEVIIRQGEEGECCYFIKEGEVEVWQAAAPDQRAELVAVLGAGRVVGEDALVFSTVRNATVIMRQHGVLMRLAKQDFFQLLRQPGIPELSLTDVASAQAAGALLIDVRLVEEYEHGHPEGAVNMPLELLPLQQRQLDRDQELLLYCQTGRRARAAAWLLGQEGFKARAVVAG